MTIGFLEKKKIDNSHVSHKLMTYELIDWLFGNYTSNNAHMLCHYLLFLSFFVCVCMYVYVSDLTWFFHVNRNVLLFVKVEKFNRRGCHSTATWIWWNSCVVCSATFLKYYSFLYILLLFTQYMSWQLYSFPDSVGDDLIIEVQDSKGKNCGRVLAQVATIAEDPVSLFFVFMI